MASLLQRLRTGSRDISTLQDYVQALGYFNYGGLSYPLMGVQQSASGVKAERIPNSFVGLATAAYESNGIVFACMLVRQLVFSAVRFRWQRLDNGQPSDMFGGPELGLLERPWPGGTTQDMLNRVIQDADLAGNAFNTAFTPLARLGGDGARTEVVRLRPDWVEIAVTPRMYRGGQLGWQKLGYLYTEDGIGVGNDPVILAPGEVSHFAPIPDPLANYRGMSWLTPVIREIQADGVMTRHKLTFFENGATPNMVVKHDAGASEEKVKRFAAWLDENFAGAANAYKTLHLYPGADATVVGKDFQQIDFKQVQGAGETRIAAAGGVPPVIVGLSEGLQGSSLNAGNYGQARRRLADGTMHPLWQNASGSLEPLLGEPRPGVRLWYDATGVPFLREDEKDAAEIASTQAQTINTLITAGYEPGSVVRAVNASDWRLLVHTGLTSVQLLPPGSQQSPTTGASDDDSSA